MLGIEPNGGEQLSQTSFRTDCWIIYYFLFLWQSCFRALYSPWSSPGKIVHCGGFPSPFPVFVEAPLIFIRDGNFLTWRRIKIFSDQIDNFDAFLC